MTIISRNNKYKTEYKGGILEIYANDNFDQDEYICSLVQEISDLRNENKLLGGQG
jgi:hypothetical protein